MVLLEQNKANLMLSYHSMKMVMKLVDYNVSLFEKCFRQKLKIQTEITKH